MIRLLKPRFPTFEETMKKIGLEKTPVGSIERLEALINEIEHIKARPWWKRINWKLWMTE